MKTTHSERFDIPELDQLSAKWPLPTHLKSLAQAMLDEILPEYPSVESPAMIHLCGIPGSGKSTYAQKLQQKKPEYYILSFDHIMLQLPGYKEDCTTVGLKEAFANWELPARGLGYYFLKRLLHEKRSIIFDHSAANESHVALLQQVSNGFYRVELHYISCKIETAYSRVKERESRTQQHTPEHYLTERAASIDRLLPKYRRVVHRYKEVSSH